MSNVRNKYSLEEVDTLRYVHSYLLTIELFYSLKKEVDIVL